MRSIRLSLVIYFLILLGLALGTVSLIVHQTSYQALHAREARTRELLNDRFQARCQAERLKLDKTLQREAQHMEKLAQSPWRRNYHQLSCVAGLLSAPVQPRAQLFTAFWAGESTNFRLGWRFALNFTVHCRPDPIYSLGQLGAAGNPAGLLLTPLWAGDDWSGWTAIRLGRQAFWSDRKRHV